MICLLKMVKTFRRQKKKHVSMKPVTTITGSMHSKITAIGKLTKREQIIDQSYIADYSPVHCLNSSVY